jgi:hypothetical protein
VAFLVETRRHRRRAPPAPAVEVVLVSSTAPTWTRAVAFLAKQLLALLTGLGDEHVAHVAVEFRDPVTDHAL